MFAKEYTMKNQINISPEEFAKHDLQNLRMQKEQQRAGEFEEKFKNLLFEYEFMPIGIPHFLPTQVGFTVHCEVQFRPMSDEEKAEIAREKSGGSIISLPDGVDPISLNTVENPNE